MTVPIYRSDPTSPVHKRAVVVKANGTVHGRNYNKDLKSGEVGISTFVNLVNVDGPLTTAQLNNALAAFDLMCQESRALLGAEPDELQRGDVVKVYKSDKEDDVVYHESYYGIVIRCTDDLVRIKYLQPNGLMRARSFLYANGWETEEFPGQRGWKALVHIYLDQNSYDEEIFQAIVNRDRDFALELLDNDSFSLWDKMSMAHALGDDEIVLQVFLEVIDEIGYSNSAQEAIEFQEDTKVSGMSLYAAAIRRLQLWDKDKDGPNDPRGAFLDLVMEKFSLEELEAIIRDGKDGSIPYAYQLIPAAMRCIPAVIEELESNPDTLCESYRRWIHLMHESQGD